MPSKASVSLSVQRLSEDSLAFEVVIREASGETRHQVSLSRDLLSRLAPGEGAESFVRRCFEFLLEREPKESILGRFDVSVIARYFPEFENEIARSKIAR
jgi:hypothetical protein